MVQDLLDATARVLVEEGWEKASTNRIAKAAGVSVGSVYQYFPNKEALILAVAHRHAAHMQRLFADTAESMAGAPIEAAVPAFVRFMFEAHQVEPELHVALVHQVLNVGLEPLQEIQATSRRMVRSFLEGHKDRLMVEDLDVAAWLCVTTVEAAVHAAVLERNGMLEDPRTETELCALLLRYLVGSAS